VMMEKEIRIKARGEFRRRHCYLPPIKMNFKKTEFNSAQEYPLKKVKLVTNCKSSGIYEQYIYQEYYAYKIFNLLTDKSFKAQLVNITYIDTEEKEKPFQKPGIIIEPTKHMTGRNSCVELETEKLGQAVCDQYQMTLVSVFQYLIGNTDWAIPNLHNVKLMRPTSFTDQSLYAVPYDFDYSGMVNTTYAVPDDKLPIKEVKDRIYQGLCPDPSILEEVIEKFIEKKEDIYALYKNSPHLDKMQKYQSKIYLDDFYRTIENRIRMEKAFSLNCTY
ncbi:MAG: hypothetical protein AAF824_23495, partial [Bacteroidota bacterium]